MAALKALIADDDDTILFALERILTENGYTVISAPNGREALARVRAERPDLVILDVMMPDLSGYEVTKAIKADAELRYVPVVLLTSQDNLEHVVRGFDEGADDYIKKPFAQDELLARLRAVVRIRQLYSDLQKTKETNEQLRREVSTRASFSNIIGHSAAMRQVFDLVAKVKDANAPILITGESGTGKELIARAIHYNSVRAEKPFLAQNCSAFNENLLESELFGHVRGSFTGAIRDKKGLFEAANEGTFFLDELGEMSPALQVKLLRVLQDGTFTPVGDTKSKQVDVRIIAATHRNVRDMVASGKFREDLFYRLNVVNIVLPALRERREDIPLLIAHFLAEGARRSGKAARALVKEAADVLANYSWPGNIRELENEIERLILLSGAEREIPAALISAHILNEGGQAAALSSGALRDGIEKLERQMIASTLARVQGNKSEAARILGISRSNLISKVQEYKLEE